MGLMSMAGLGGKGRLACATEVEFHLLLCLARSVEESRDVFSSPESF